MFISLKEPNAPDREYLLNVDHIICVVNSDRGTTFEFDYDGTKKYLTSTPYEEVKKMLLDGQVGERIRVEVEEA